MKERVRRPERKKFIAFYVSDEEKEQIVSSALQRDMTVSDYCRKMLLQKNSFPEETTKDE